MPGNVPTGIPTGVGSLFSTEVTQAIAAAARFVMPAGTFYVYTVGADVRLQVINSLGVWNFLTAAGTQPPGPIISDGASGGFVNGGAAPENIIYIRLP